MITGMEYTVSIWSIIEFLNVYELNDRDIHILTTHNKPENK